MRFATPSELQALFDLVSIETIVRTQDCFEDLRPQDSAINDAIPTWNRALDKPSAHSLDGVIANPYKDNEEVSIRVVGVVASDGVFGIFSKTSHGYSMVDMQVVELDPTGAQPPNVRPMRSVPMELCGPLTHPALPEVLEIRPATGPARNETKSGPRI